MSLDETLPGLNPARLLRLTRAAVARTRLDLRGAVVLTEAATGAYAVTPVLAAMAGADRVYALTRSSSYGNAEQARAATESLAQLAGVASRVEVVSRKTREIVESADVVTNSGHVRPIDAETISWMKSGAVVPFMYESWEFREGDVDLDACIERGIKFAGTSLAHPLVGVFPFLGSLAVKLLHDAGVAVHGNALLLLCDNPLGPYLDAFLTAAGASVLVTDRLSSVPDDGVYDAIVVALGPGHPPACVGREAETIAARWPGLVVAQFCGDLDRDALRRAGVPAWPPKAPRPGHMGILPSGIGPEPVVRLQSGGLKVAEILLRGPQSEPGGPSLVQPWTPAAEPAN